MAAPCQLNSLSLETFALSQSHSPVSGADRGSVLCWPYPEERRTKNRGVVEISSELSSPGQGQGLPGSFGLAVGWGASYNAIAYRWVQQADTNPVLFPEFLLRRTPGGQI